MPPNDSARTRCDEREQHDGRDLDRCFDHEAHRVPSFLALAISSAIRSSSSSFSRALSPPSSAATVFSAEPSKNVSTRCRSADFRAAWPRHRRGIDVTEPLLFVADVSLFFEDAQLGPHRRIAGFARQLFHHFAGGRLAAPVEDVDDLPLAPGERAVGAGEGFRHSVIFVARDAREITRTPDGLSSAGSSPVKTKSTKRSVLVSALPPRGRPESALRDVRVHPPDHWEVARFAIPLSARRT